MTSTKKEYKEFQALLRKGIGSRSQKEFAEACGIAPAHLNRMLNNETINCPSRTTIASFVRNIPDASLNEFLVACGYDPITIEDRAGNVETLLRKGFEESRGKLWNSMDELLQNIYDNYREENGRFGRKMEEKEILTMPEAELQTKLTFKWGDNEYLCRTEFILYYAKTQHGRVVTVASSLTEDTDTDSDWTNLDDRYGTFDVDRVKQVRHTEIKHIVRKGAKRMMPSSLSPEERLLEAIFGGSEKFETTIAGYGFYYNETPEGFRDFLFNHAGSFCTTDEETELYQKMLLPGADPDEVFSGYSFSSSFDEGTGAVVAKIMYMELQKEFLYHAALDPETAPDSCVMMPAPDLGKDAIPEELLIDIFSYAKELKVPTFGMCYHKTMMSKKKSQLFNTNEFFLTFK